MEWTENLSVGIDAIDNQHKELIKRVNRFYAALRSGEGIQETLNVLEFLSQYVLTHFREEEAIQVQYSYPRYAEHKQLHREFVDTVKGFRSEIESRGVTKSSSTLIATTVSNWLVNHISVMDKDVGRHVKAKLGNA